MTVKNEGKNKKIQASRVCKEKISAGKMFPAAPSLMRRGLRQGANESHCIVNDRLFVRVRLFTTPTGNSLIGNHRNDGSATAIPFGRKWQAVTHKRRQRLSKQAVPRKGGQYKRDPVINIRNKVYWNNLQQSESSNQPVADELLKLVKLKEFGVLTNNEFENLKRKLMHN